MTIDAATVQARQDIFEALNPPGSNRVDKKAKSVEDMGSEEFLALMVAQLENQDPTNPMDNMAMMSQLAQFGTVGGIQELNEGFSSLTATLTGSQAMQASSMVGRSVATDSNVGSMGLLGFDASDQPVYGIQASVDLGSNSQGGIFHIQNLGGELIYSGPITAGNGTQVITWDGLDNNGQQMPAGQYRISAESFFGGQARPVSTYAHEQVMSVSVGAGSEVTLNLTNGQSLRVDQVKEFF